MLRGGGGRVCVCVSPRWAGKSIKSCGKLEAPEGPAMQIYCRNALPASSGCHSHAHYTSSARSLVVSHHFMKR